MFSTDPNSTLSHLSYPINSEISPGPFALSPTSIFIQINHPMSPVTRSTRHRNITPPLTSFATVNIQKYLKANNPAAYDLRILCDKRTIEHNSSGDRVQLLTLLKEHDQDTLYGVLNDVNVKRGDSTAVLLATKGNSQEASLKSPESQENKIPSKRKRVTGLGEEATTTNVAKKTKLSPVTPLKPSKHRRGLKEVKQAAQESRPTMPEVKREELESALESSKPVDEVPNSIPKKRKLEVFQDAKVSPHASKKPKVEEPKTPTKQPKPENPRLPQSSRSDYQSPASFDNGSVTGMRPKATPISPRKPHDPKTRDPNTCSGSKTTRDYQDAEAKQRDATGKESSKEAAKSSITGAKDELTSESNEIPKRAKIPTVRTVEVLKTSGSTTTRVIKTVKQHTSCSLFASAAQNIARASSRKAKPKKQLLPWETDQAPRGIYHEYKY